MRAIRRPIVRVRMPYSVRTDPLHDATVGSPMGRELSHRMVGRIVDRAWSGGTLAALMHVNLLPGAGVIEVAHTAAFFTCASSSRPQ